VKTRERAFQGSQGRWNLVEFVCVSELLQLKGRIDRGGGAEICDGTFQSVG